jgi:hypothetical protein
VRVAVVLAREPPRPTIARTSFRARGMPMSRVYVSNDGNGPLIVGIVIVIIVLILLWWLLFANAGGPAPSGVPGPS